MAPSASLQMLKRWSSIEAVCPLTGADKRSMQVNHIRAEPALQLKVPAPDDVTTTTPTSESTTEQGSKDPVPTAGSSNVITLGLDKLPDPMQVDPRPDEFFFRHGAWSRASIPLHARRNCDHQVYLALLAKELTVTKSNEPTTVPKTKKDAAFALMRSAVSQNKIRYQRDGFDLDLTYITDRIIAMGFPSSGRESYFRNPVDEVERFFKEKHAGRFRVYNLCSERHYDDDARFGGRWRRYPFDDHNAPSPIRLIPSFCRDAANFLNDHEDNVVAIHCKAGKGRTGLMISCLLMYINPALRSPGDALQFFGEVRTNDSKGVTIPSQMRYVRYWDAMLKNHDGQDPPKRTLRLTSVTVTTAVRPAAQTDLYVTIVENNVMKIDTRQALKHPSRREDGGFKFDFKDKYPPDQLPALCGDLRFHAYHHNSILSDEHLFHFWLNTSLCDLREVISKKDLDKACKDKKHEATTAGITVEVEFEEFGSDGSAPEAPQNRRRSAAFVAPEAPMAKKEAEKKQPTSSTSFLSKLFK